MTLNELDLACTKRFHWIRADYAGLELLAQAIQLKIDENDENKAYIWDIEPRNREPLFVFYKKEGVLACSRTFDGLMDSSVIPSSNKCLVSVVADNFVIGMNNNLAKSLKLYITLRFLTNSVGAFEFIIMLGRILKGSFI